jgi:hypothetical protein
MVKRRLQAISTVLKEADEQPNDQARVAYLSEYKDNKAMQTLLNYTLNPNIEWKLPDSDPPYKPCAFDDQEAGLYQEARRLYLFTNDPKAPEMKAIRREALFISILESVDKEDAKLLLQAKNKKLPYKNLTPKLLNQVFNLGI